MKIGIIDIETPPIPKLISEIDKIYCLAIKINGEKTKCFTYVFQSNSDGNLNQALNLINSCDLIVGHNIIKFDLPIIQKVLGKVTPKICDTLIDAKLMYSSDELIDIDKRKLLPPSLIGSYSLKAFGYRFNLNKIDFVDFTKLCPEMIEYCKRDVDLTYMLYKHLSSNPHYPSELVRQTEYHFANCIFKQQEYGFYFDFEKAKNYATSLKINKMAIERKLKKVFSPILVPDGEVITPAKLTRKKVWRELPLNPLRNLQKNKPLQIGKNGKWKFPKKSAKWFITPHSYTFSYTDGAYQKLKLQSFNPGSRSQVVQRIMKDYGWKPTNYTEKGSVRLEFD